MYTQCRKKKNSNVISTSQSLQTFVTIFKDTVYWSWYWKHIYKETTFGYSLRLGASSQVKDTLAYKYGQFG